MNRASRYWILVMLSSGSWLGGCSTKHKPGYSSLKDAATIAQLKQFVAEKQSQADSATNEAAPGFTPFFAAAKTGDWLAISNAFLKLREHAGQYENLGNTNDDRLRGPRWEAVKEIWGAFDAFGEGNEKYSAAFGRDIIASIPPGSIYFGGTDPGRFIVTALCRSQVRGDPFFVLTQNALADATYLEYLRDLYGDNIVVPSHEDSQKCFQDYTEDATRRSQLHQLKPGEDVHLDASGRMQVSGQVAVMEISGLMAKHILEQNPNPEFFIEESFPFDWMYPQLEPHGLIFKLNRQPAATLSDDIVQSDHDYWTKYVRPMIGDWLNDDTTVADVAAFAEKTFGRRDFSGFKGDPLFIQNAYSHRMFSKLRSSIAGLYAWRVNHAGGATDEERMVQAADFAFRQAWALCPDSPEAVFRYVNFLLAQRRVDDAVLVAETAMKLPHSKGDTQLGQLVTQLKQYRMNKPIGQNTSSQ
jgi:hypothetical protein